MFTGIITDIGEVVAREGGRFTIRCGYDADSIALGASIACDGCCLTVTNVTGAKGSDPSHRTPRSNTTNQREGSDPMAIFTVDVSNETLSLTTLRDWAPGRRVNLERSLKAGDELGGHIVSGHVDGLARIVEIRPDGESRRFTFEAPAQLARFIAQKGSIALDGTSLTVNEVRGDHFGVNLIPHTLTHTTWGSKRAGEDVNLEIDPLARYVARLIETAASANSR
jgi:riboflavin synthase